MNDSSTAYAALSSLFSLLGLCWLIFWLYRDYETDRFRQEMFCLRDSLFDAAHAGKIAFDHPAYGTTRRLMNGFIRKAHTMSLLHLVVFLILSRRRPIPKIANRFEGRWARDSKDLDPCMRDLIEGYRQRMHVLVFKHLVLSSPILLIAILLTIVLPIVFWVAWRVWTARLLAHLADLFRPIDAAAAAIGAPA
jgi:hypothetical protein